MYYTEDNPEQHYHIETEKDGRQFADGIFKYIFLNETILISIKLHWMLFLRVQLV